MNKEIAKYLIDNFNNSEASYKSCQLTKDKLTLIQENENPISNAEPEKE